MGSSAAPLRRLSSVQWLKECLIFAFFRAVSRRSLIFFDQSALLFERLLHMSCCQVALAATIYLAGRRFISMVQANARSVVVRAHSCATSDGVVVRAHSCATLEGIYCLRQSVSSS